MATMNGCDTFSSKESESIVLHKKNLGLKKHKRKNPGTL